MFESQSQETEVVKTGSDNSTAKRSTAGLSVTALENDHVTVMGPRKQSLLADAMCHKP